VRRLAVREPSRGVPPAAAEAMACRCPVVSTRVGGPMDIIEEGVNGFLVDTEDAEALAERLVHVLHMAEDRWRAMSNAAYATAIECNWDDSTALIEKALDTAIAQARHPGAAVRGVRIYESCRSDRDVRLYSRHLPAVGAAADAACHYRRVPSERMNR